VHRSPGFITSNLIGKDENGVMIKEYEASHGTVADMWHDHLEGKETSMNPLGMTEALVSAMLHSAEVSEEGPEAHQEYIRFANRIRKSVQCAFSMGHGTRDLYGPEGVTTERFVEVVGRAIQSGNVELFYRYAAGNSLQLPVYFRTPYENVKITKPLRELFNDLDTDGNGSISIEELSVGLQRLGMKL